MRQLSPEQLIFVRYYQLFLFSRILWLRKQALENSHDCAEDTESYKDPTGHVSKRHGDIKDHDGWRVDSEVHGPGKGGNVHIQKGKEKFFFHPQQKVFMNEEGQLRKGLLSKSRQNLLIQMIHSLYYGLWLPEDINWADTTTEINQSFDISALPDHQAKASEFVAFASTIISPRHLIGQKVFEAWGNRVLTSNLPEIILHWKLGLRSWKD